MHQIYRVARLAERHGGTRRQQPRRRALIAGSAEQEQRHRRRQSEIHVHFAQDRHRNVGTVLHVSDQEDAQCRRQKQRAAKRIFPARNLAPLQRDVELSGHGAEYELADAQIGRYVQQP